MYEFLIVNDVMQVLPPAKFGGGPWIHLATVTVPPRNIGGKGYPAREFICFKHQTKHKTYIEEVDLTSPGIIKRIQDDQLWKELAEFLTNKGILAAAAGKEYKIAKPKK
jgi:hypothetical protein